MLRGHGWMLRRKLREPVGRDRAPIRAGRSRPTEALKFAQAATGGASGPVVGIRVEGEHAAARTRAVGDRPVDRPNGAFRPKMCREAQVANVVLRSISGHLTEKMQQRYSTARGHEQQSAIARVIALTQVEQRVRGGIGPQAFPRRTRASPSIRQMGAPLGAPWVLPVPAPA
jgi:hypothetical protein